ncbi:mechanosensitive ion channel [Kaistella sp. G5-32]|uniref:Mechanosensitive ion channel n=1 Tax=Kaistella gelatinilytica TaxID=2787636 RepID=A0ABS0F7U3_9FLAO|nr:mechanosensitive ion channel domain-containing protein [Kaistella gelatinilytica]MBF8455781.1 mechanosensitive ion channel [Kaistella gelatinilytica]
MDFDLKKILEYKLFSVGKDSIELSSVLFLILFIVAISFTLRILRKIIYSTSKLDDSKKFTIFSLIKYVFYVVGFIMGMNMIGINVSVLLGASAALLVGVGLGLQNIFSDFVSGIVLLLDSSIKVGDIIETDKLVCQVKEINLRTTTVLTRDDKYIILPNTILTKNSVLNWTHTNPNSRFDIQVGVSYSADIHQVMKILIDTAKQNEKISLAPPAFVRLNDYADSSLIFNLYFWAEDVFRVENLKSDLRIKIFEEFKKNNIDIPFPQRVLHFNQE